MLSRTRMLVVAFAVSVFGFGAATASADPAVVFNHNGSVCQTSGLGGIYDGSGTIVVKDGIQLYTCIGSLSSGSGVDQVVRVSGNNCVFTFTPGNKSITVCHWQ